MSFDYADIGNFENNALINIREAVEKTMPVVEIENISVLSHSKKESSDLPAGIAQINISITYNVPKIKIIGAKLIAVIYAGG